MFISYSQKKGFLYASITTSRRDGAVVTKEYVNLGRVLDKERGIYRNRQKGVFTYDINTDTYGPAPADFISPPKTRRGRYYTVGRKKKSFLSMQFGDVFFFDQFYRKTGIAKAVEAIDYGNSDTLPALLCYYVTSSEANSHAEDWYELSYARKLWPNANMASQRIREALCKIGLEENKRRFFGEYYKFIRKCQMTDTKEDYGMAGNGESGDGILIDSSGLPNESHLPVTGVNNHNGIISLEVRVIYVVQQSTGLPLFFRYVPGNVIDASTIVRTVHELKQMHINTKFALLDAGYYTKENADALIDAGISFVTRVHSNHKIFMQAMNDQRDSLESEGNLVLYNGRILYIAETSIMIGRKEDHNAYGYLCLDTAMQNEGRKQLVSKAVDENMRPEEIYRALRNKGMFMLVSTRKIAKEKILNLYYTRNQIEEFFRIGKKDGKMLPLGIESEDALCGHLLMTFVSSTILKILSDRLTGSGFSVSDIFSILRHQTAIVHEEELITSEPVKKMNQIYKWFKIKCPTSIPQFTTG